MRCHTAFHALRRGLIVVGMALLWGCGGEEPDDTWVITTAPQWMAEVDLPGCDCVALPDATTQLLGHPAHNELLIAVVEGEPTCIDSLEGMAAALGSLPSGLMTRARSVPEDDPIPIKQPGTGDRPTDQGTEDGDLPPPPPGWLIKFEASDDPIPIRVVRMFQ